MRVDMTKEQVNKVINRQQNLLVMMSSKVKTIVEKIYHSIPTENSPQWKWHHDFMDSMLKQINNGYTLSDKQLYHVAKIEMEISLAPQQRAEDMEFKNRFVKDETLQEDLSLAVNYYRKSGYWSNLINDYEKNKNNKDWAPSKRIYDRAVVNNKFVQRYLSEYKAPPKYSKGQMITLRSNSSVRSSNEKVESNYTPGRFVYRVYREGDIFMVLNYDPNDVEPKRGGKGVKVLALGTNEVFSLREADIKKLAKKVKK